MKSGVQRAGSRNQRVEFLVFQESWKVAKVETFSSIVGENKIMYVHKINELLVLEEVLKNFVTSSRRKTNNENIFVL